MITIIFTSSFVVQQTSALTGYQAFYSENTILFTDPNAVACQTSSVDITTNTPTATLEEFVKQYAQFAVETGKKYGIPYEAILAQGTLESAMGKSKLTTQYNNFFGIKAGTSWTGPIATFNTQEDMGGGNMTTISAAFRAYASPQEGFDGYGDFITSNSRYQDALKYPGDPYAYIKEIKNAGYATDSNYVSKVSGFIDKIIKIVADNNISPPSSVLTPTPVDNAARASTSSVLNATSCSSGTSLSGTNNQRIIQIAKAELAKNVVEYDSNVLKYTDGNRWAWCADFVSWVYKEAGSPLTGGNSDGGWRIDGVLAMQAWFKQNGTYFEVGSESPQPGDVAFYIGSQTPDGDSTQHVNLVVAVNGNKMTTIGGNQSNRVTIGSRQIALGADSLVGFGRITSNATSDKY